MNPDEGWSHQAACHYTRPGWVDLWHDPYEHNRRQAVQLCRLCPVRAECHLDREAALDRGVRLYGVVAGTDYGWTKGYARHGDDDTDTDEEATA